MVLLFSDNELRRLCEVEREAKKRLGVPCARKLRTRLADLMAAPNVGALIAGRPHPLSGDRAGQLALDLTGLVRLCFEPADPVPALDAAGAIDWPRVTTIRIVYLGDYHA
ncbi:MAG: killer suppression protein HigA [Deltaproteobacteria bacterium]|nr:killer suppression protein HigA [Deltaproteobacteria bacterium]MBK9368085.1 killer suppression protein HigA [Deltaproteobacteria bacterium]MBK9648809.1 killer suppression protein HigA [Deltaproteobacteria bacterium]